MYQFIQYPGDTLYVPTGWWHAVVNLDTTVGCTQNFCDRSNFEKVWCFVAVVWLWCGARPAPLS